MPQECAGLSLIRPPVPAATADVSPRPGGLEVDHEFELRRATDRQVSGLAPFKILLRSQPLDGDHGEVSRTTAVTATAKPGKAPLREVDA